MENKNLLGKMNDLMNEGGRVGGGEHFTQSDSIDPQEVDEIEISTGATDVKISEQDQPTIEIELKTYEGGPVLDVKSHEKVLQIEAQQTEHTLQFYKPSAELSVTLPHQLWKRMTTHTHSGDVSVKAIQATRFSLKASSGDLDIEHIHSDKVDLITSSGDIEVKEVETRILSFSASSGDAEFTRIQGSIRGNTSSGEITVRSHEGESLDLMANSGDIDVAKAMFSKGTLRTSSGEIETMDLTSIETSFSTHSGDVTCHRLAGSVSGSANSGDVELYFTQPGRVIDIKTSSGEITLHQPDQPWNAVVKLNTSSGDMNVSVPLNKEGRQAKGELTGEAGSGEGKIELRSSSGDIQLS